MKSLLKGRKGGTAKVDFQVTIHTLAPWAPGGGPLAVAWRRGAAKRGLAGPPVHPSLAGGGGYAAYDFGQAFTVPATLTKVCEVGVRERGREREEAGRERRERQSVAQRSNLIIHPSTPCSAPLPVGARRPIRLQAADPGAGAIRRRLLPLLLPLSRRSGHPRPGHLCAGRPPGGRGRRARLRGRPRLAGLALALRRPAAGHGRVPRGRRRGRRCAWHRR